MSLLFTRFVYNASPNPSVKRRRAKSTLQTGLWLSFSLLCGVSAGAQGRADAPRPVLAPLASGAVADLVPGQTAIAGDLLVGLEPGVNDRAFRRQIGPVGQVMGRSAPLNAYRIRLNAGVSDALALQWLRHQAGIVYAENNHRIQIAATPNDASFAAQYGPRKVKADVAWGAWKPQGQVILAIVDTGVDYNHPDLTNVMLKDTQGNVIGHDSTGSGTFLDGYGHGTHVAGIAGAQINNGTSYTNGSANYGTTGVVGWNGVTSVSDTSHVKIMPVRVLDNSGSGSDAEVADGIVWAADHGAQIISMSLGEPDDPNNPGPPATLNAAVQYAWKKNVVIVAAAGNSNTSAYFYPAALPNVISVAATDANDNISGYSNYGGWVTTAAPGDNILSTFVTYVTGPNWGTYYGYLSGTSMATPHVAGEAALLFAQKLGLTNQQVHDLIINNTDAVAAGGKGLAAGAGRVNFATALAKVSGASGLTGLFSTGLDSNGNPAQDGGSDLHYSLVSTPGGKSGTSYVTLQKSPISSGLWMLDTSASKWISPIADESTNADAPGSYTYQTTFTVSGDPATVQISGNVAADNTVAAIILNGRTVATNVSSGFQAFSSFTISSGFVTGTNTLQFVVNNSGTDTNPSGFRCELYGSAAATGSASIPAAPTNLTATAGNAQITLNWTAPATALSYNIKRSTSLSGPFATICTLKSGTSYTDNGINYDGSSQVPNGTPMYYIVTAMNTAGESAASNTAGATPRANGVGSISGLFNTGIDGNGNPVADGAVDPHFALISTPGGSGGTSYVTLQKSPISSGLWILDTATSKWISPIADESTNADAPGNYTYQTTFTVSGDATAVQIACQLAADNTVAAIILNGQTIATNVSSGFQAFSSFTISRGFVTGTNTLQFVVNNAGTSTNPSGFRCELTGTRAVTAGSISGLFNTGLDGNNSPTADGANDAHYALISTPGGTSGTSYVTLQKSPISSGLWILDTATSKWISPIADESTNADAPGSYTYQTTFTVSGDATAVKISGMAAGDNTVTAIILNGQTIATNVSSGFQAFSSFTISRGFVTGTNTLQFVVNNAGTSTNPSGFRCEMTPGLK